MCFSQNLQKKYIFSKCIRLESLLITSVLGRREVTITMLRDAVVQFNRSDRIYEPGSIVSGYIKFQLYIDTIVGSFYADLIGQARTCFPCGFLRCIGRETYFEQRVVFIPVEHEDYSVTLKPGIHRFYFNFILPLNIPDTVSRQWGNISYIIKFYIDRPRPRVYKLSREFYVKKRVNTLLPEPSVVRLPLFINYWFNGGQILGYMDLPTSVYTAGTVIPIKIVLRNYSTVEILKVVCRLTKKMQFAGSFPVPIARCDRKVVAIKHFNNRIHPEQQRFMRSRLQVPSLFDSLTNCNIIRDRYTIELTIQILGPHTEFGHNEDLKRSNIQLR
ncbi:uncharacterized protein CBL_13089 [Carabus blaptoides fortunei]